MKIYKRVQPGFWCDRCNRKHQSIFYHVEAIESQMQLDRKAILLNVEYIKRLQRELHNLRIFVMVVVLILAFGMFVEHLL